MWRGCDIGFIVRKAGVRPRGTAGVCNLAYGFGLYLFLTLPRWLAAPTSSGQAVQLVARSCILYLASGFRLIALGCFRSLPLFIYFYRNIFKALSLLVVIYFQNKT